MLSFSRFGLFFVHAKKKGNKNTKKGTALRTVILMVTAIFMALLATACSDSKTQTESKSTMKCGAGKCGANMIDGSSALAKKQRNILVQMRDDDPRKSCVLNAETTKALYDCVRDPETGRLSKKCGNDTKCGGGMKCGGSMKCGADMKCGSGKCG